MIKAIGIPVLAALVILSCQSKSSDTPPGAPQLSDTSCSPGSDTLDILHDDTGTAYVLYSDGKVFKATDDGSCEFFLQYFDPAFFTENYVVSDTALYIYADTRELVRIRNEIHENFEGYAGFTELFMMSLADSAKNWNAFTLQSPAKPTVAEYVALRTCILANTCTFIDNRIDLAGHPEDSSNKCLKFTAVAPSVDMVTSKSSFENTILFCDIDDELNYEADYYILSGMPMTLADFESSWFESGPGPRIIIKEDKYLAVELKYGDKPTYRQAPGSEIELPVSRWVHLKLHLVFRPDSTGVIQLWQDGTLILDTHGRTLPLPISLQTNAEIGISATNRATELLVDNIALTITRH